MSTRQAHRVQDPPAQLLSPKHEILVLNTLVLSQHSDKLCIRAVSSEFLLLAYQNRADVEDADQTFAPFSYSVIEHTCLNQDFTHM